MSKHKLNVDKRITLDAKHQEMLLNFKEIQKSLPAKRQELLILLKEYKNLNGISLKMYTGDIFDRKHELKNQILELNDKIRNIENKNGQNDYYLNVGQLLHSYYENINITSNQKRKKVHSRDTSWNKLDEQHPIVTDADIYKNRSRSSEELDDEKLYKNVLDFFNNRSEEKSGNDPKNTDDMKYTSTKISDFMKTESNFKRTDFLDDYLKVVDESYISGIKFDNKIDHCPRDGCVNQEMVIISSEGIQICEKCGLQLSVLIESDKPSFKDPPPEISYFAYKRINHFNEWLAQFQAKESTEIPQEVYDKILLEIKKERISNLAQLTNSKIRAYLKKLKLNKYYEHIPHILNRLNGLPPPIMSKQVEEKLRIMFKEIQGPFMEVCPKTRKNFLSYSYVLHKFVELLEMDQYKSCFPLLKSREKLHQQDMIWKDICKKLNWHFIKSI